MNRTSKGFVTGHGFIAIPESLYPEAATLKPTRASASGDLAQNSKGHSNSGIAAAMPKTIVEYWALAPEGTLLGTSTRAFDSSDTA
jgi:hypothetical protein